MSHMFTAVLGTGAAVLLAAVAYFCVRYGRKLSEARKLPLQWAEQAGTKIGVVVAALAGALFTLVGAGQFFVGVLTSLAGLVGAAGSVILLLLAIFTFGDALCAIIGKAKFRDLIIAFSFPLVAAAMAFGFFHDVGAQMQDPAMQLQAFVHGLGG